MGRKFHLIFVISLLFTNTGTAEYKIPKDDHTITHWGSADNQELPQKFSMLVWNVHKGSEKEKWAEDFTRISSRSHIALIQEGMHDQFMPNIFKSLRGWAWQFITSFIYENNNETGVAIGAMAFPLTVEFQRSPAREPIVATPKMIAINTYRLNNLNEKLLVLNIHAINFVLNSDFQDQINQVVPRIQSHEGPVIFAGDFNTWNNGRQSFLDRTLARLGLKKVRFHNDRRGLKLDHIYYSKLNSRYGIVFDQVKTSDHAPLFAIFETP